MTVQLRELLDSDIIYILDYWFRSPEGFVEGMGVDLDKMPKEQALKEHLLSRLKENADSPESKMSVFIITVDNRPVGMHTLSPVVEGDSGIFHAHIWDKSMRGRGVALKSYPLAMRAFKKRFNLKKIVFKTPVQNTGAIKVKEKLKIPFVGEEVIDFSIIKAGTRAKVFEWTDEFSK